MSEIIPKEKILKSVRKGLVVPSVQPFANLDFDTEIYNDTKVKKEESVVEVYLEKEHSYFQSCGNKYEFLLTLKKLMDVKGWKEPVCHENALSELLNDNGIKTQLNIPDEKNPLITMCVKALSKPSVFLFDNRFQLVRKILAAPTLILVLTESQMKVYYEDKSHFALNPLQNYTHCAIHPKELVNKDTYLFVINDIL